MPRLYLGNLPFNATSASIQEFFGATAVENIKIVTDRDTNRPRGFAFVDISSDVNAAIASFDGQSMGGRTIRVSEARDKGHDKPVQRRSKHEGRDREWP